MKKRPFLLLEILIAFSLVLICLIPLVKQPLKLYKQEMEWLEKMELERLADWTFTEVKELLIKNEIAWKKIPGKKEKTDLFPLPYATLCIPGCKTKEVQRSFQLTGRGEKVGKQNETIRQLGIDIFLNEHKYTFRLPIKK